MKAWFPPLVSCFPLTTRVGRHRPSSCHQAFITSSSLHHVIKPSSCHQAFITSSSLHHVIKPSSRHQAFITSSNLHHVIKPSSCHQAFIMSSSLHHVIKPSSCHQAFITSSSLHHVIKPSSRHQTFITSSVSSLLSTRLHSSKLPYPFFLSLVAHIPEGRRGISISIITALFQFTSLPLD